MRFINADLIAAGLSPFAPGAVLVRASRLMLEEIHACARRGESFAFETTLSGLGYRPLIWKWQKMGYRVYLYFLSLADADIAVARVGERVRQGGHGIPEDIIRRHYAAGLHNFDRYYRKSVDAWAMYNNSMEQPCFLEFGENPTRLIKKHWSSMAWQYRLTKHTHAPAWRPKTYNDLAASNDADLRGSHAALQRAAEMAQRIAIQTKTSIVVSRKQGKFVRLTASRLAKQTGMTP